MGKRVHRKKIGKCTICDVELDITHMHHIEERAKGGANVAFNEVELCPNCHLASVHGGRIKICGILYTTGGWMLEYEENGETKMKALGR